MATDYKARHAKALANTSIATTAREAHETAIVAMFKAWIWYAAAHKIRFESEVGHDGVLGDPWKEIGLSLLALLNGETGQNVDCGSMDHDIRATLAAHGIDTSNL